MVPRVEESSAVPYSESGPGEMRPDPAAGRTPLKRTGHHAQGGEDLLHEPWPRLPTHQTQGKMRGRETERLEGFMGKMR